MSECDREASIMRGLWPTSGCCAVEEKLNAGNRMKNVCVACFSDVR